MKDKEMNRRRFTRALALAPLAIATERAWGTQQVAKGVGEGKTSSATVQTSPPPQTATKRVPKTAAEYNRHPPVLDPSPFEGPIVFTREPLQQKLQPFAPQEVTLLPGPLLEARDWNRGYMMRLPNDRLLHNFKVNAGMPSTAVPLGGWEAPTAELRGHFVGHYLSAMALLYASTGDLAVKAKADDLVAALAVCQAKLGSGYLSAFPLELFERLDRREKVWAPFYTIHKLMAGLLEMSRSAGNEQALRVVLALAGWVDSWTAARNEEHMQEILKTEFGGMSDVLYSLADVTGDDRWANVGDRFVKKSFFTPLALRQDVLKGLHANTHMPQVVGAARRYEISSDYRFEDVAEFFWETVAESRSYATGGTANTESWLTGPNRLSVEKRASSHHQECCCAYNMMKLSRHLYGWSGDVRYIDYYERNLLNHRLGTIQPGTGLTTYFLSLSVGAWKTLATEDQTFWCCTGSALEDFAKLNDTIYFHDSDGVYVNLFTPSRLKWRERGIQVEQRTAFPHEGRSSLLIQETSSGPWTLYLRVPAWAGPGTAISVNGKQECVASNPGSYLAIRRSWKTGDRVELSLPMCLTAEPLRDDGRDLAFLYGPLVLAGQFPLEDIGFDLQHNQGPEIQELPPLSVPVLSTARRPIEQWMKPVAGKPLEFEANKEPETIRFKPLNQSWQRYVVYWERSG